MNQSWQIQWQYAQYVGEIMIMETMLLDSTIANTCFIGDVYIVGLKTTEIALYVEQTFVLILEIIIFIYVIISKYDE